MLFEKGVHAINALTKREDTLYYCPICTQPFNRKSLDSGELTLEHIPPKAQGGQGIALTCSICNNQAGRSVDAAVCKRTEALSITPLYSQIGTYNGHVILDFGTERLRKININLSVIDSSVRLHLMQNMNHPDTCDLIKKHFFFNQSEQSDGISIKITKLCRYNFWHSKVGDLRSAFLVCFAYFGYRYAFDRRLDIVRHQIQHYNEIVIDGFWIQSDDDDQLSTSICLLSKPFSALSVRLGRVSVLLPWLGSPCSLYEHLIKTYPQGGDIVFSGTRLPWPKTLEMKLDLTYLV